MKNLIICLAFLLSACVKEQLIAPQEVKIPIVVSCIDEVPKKPIFLTNADYLAMNDFQLTASLYEERQLRIMYEAELEAVLISCKGKLP